MGKVGSYLNFIQLSGYLNCKNEENNTHKPESYSRVQLRITLDYLSNHMLLGKIIDQTLQIRGVMCQRVIVVESVDLYVIQSEILIHIDPYKYES